jgi:hypothetical protein
MFNTVLRCVASCLRADVHVRVVGLCACSRACCVCARLVDGRWVGLRRAYARGCTCVWWVYVPVRVPAVFARAWWMVGGSISARVCWCLRAPVRCVACSLAVV